MQNSTLANMQKHNHKLHHLLPGNLPTQPAVTANILCLDAELIDLRILLYHTDFTTDSRFDHDFIIFYNLLLFICN